MWINPKTTPNTSQMSTGLDNIDSKILLTKNEINKFKKT